LTSFQFVFLSSSYGLGRTTLYGVCVIVCLQPSLLSESLADLADKYWFNVLG